MRSWQPHTQRFSSLVFSPDGKLLATTAGQSKLVWLWDAATGVLVRKLAGGTFPAKAVAFSPDGKHVAAMQAGPDIRVWQVDTGKLVAVLGVESGGPKTLAFSPDGAALVAPDFDHLWRWDAPAGPDLARRAKSDAIRTAERVGFTPSGRFVVTRDSLVHVAAGPEQPARAFADPHGHATVNAFAFSRDESRQAVAYQSATAAVFDLADPRAKPVLLTGHKGKQVRAIGFAADGRTVVTAGIDGTCRFWDAITGAPGRVFDWGQGAIATAAFAPDGLTCAVGGAKGQVVVWDLDA